MAVEDQLVRVDSLTLTVIVDNSIEWMTKLPPGFQPEIRIHLSNDPPRDERTGAPFLDLENYCCGAHGLSVLVETRKGESKYTCLFDTGPDSRSIVRNCEALKAPIHDVERVILSHWHADHSGGLLAFLQHRGALLDGTTSETGKATSSRIVVDLHPDRPIARGIAPPPTFDRVICRLPEDPAFDEISKAGAAVEVNRDAHVVGDGTVFVSGEIPRISSFEQGLLGGVRWLENSEGKGEWKTENHIMDQRYVAVDVLGKGLVILTACSHAGVVNVVRDAVRRFNRPVHMILGGLHLAGPELASRIPPTVDFFASSLRPSPTYILPMHCTGFAAKIALEKAFGEGCVPAGTGTKIEIGGIAGADDRLSASIVE